LRVAESNGTTCAACGTLNRGGRKFCAECGATLGISCPDCGAANEPGERFCGECGSSLVAPAKSAERPALAVERRLVSVLFADLVGFTPLSENRDAEDVRELLSRYIELASGVIARYGGEVEKFIGDAVMAVWGTPVAQEDDAERAVRAALDLVEAVGEFGRHASVDHLAARAAILTGEAVVNLGAARAGNGCRRSRQRRVARAGARRARIGPRGRGYSPRDRAGDRVLRCRYPRGKGKGRADRVVAGPPHHGRPAW